MKPEEKDKRYLVFGYSSYYPTGGMNDLVDSFDTVKECIECIKNDSEDYHEVYDRMKGLEVLMPGKLYNC